MSVRAAYAQAPWAGTVLPAPVVGQLPPPIPGERATFTFATQGGAYPWAFASWAGGYPPATYPGGGVLAHADPAAGVMAVQVWWPSATILQVVRVGSDGARTPVRDAYPLTVSAPTRRNFCTNPSLEAGLNGFVPDAGSPTLTQLADATAPAGAYVLRATNAGAGSSAVAVPTTAFPTAFTGVAGAPGQTATVAFSARLSARPSGLTATVAWTNAAGGALATSTVTFTADQVNTAVSQWGRLVGVITPPTGAMTPTWKITATGMPAGGTVDLDALVLEPGTTDGSFFDGRTLGAVWLGAADLSAAVLAPVVTVLDGECPLDTLVSYQVATPGITGGRVASDPSVLAAQGLSFLTHPTTPGAPVPVQLEGVPALVRTLRRGVFWPLAGQAPIVVSDTTRHSPNGTVAMVWLSFAERDALLTLLTDAAPLLLRTPADYGLDPSLWLAFGDVTEDRGQRKAWQDTGVLKAEFNQVDRPGDS